MLSIYLIKITICMEKYDSLDLVLNISPLSIDLKILLFKLKLSLSESLVSRYTINIL
ncbi:hypothetical protein C8N37_105305 [Sphingobacterium faecium]|nr:hypothetical protein C8N37_105305 [Sphingobacterium faecium]